MTIDSFLKCGRCGATSEPGAGAGAGAGEGAGEPGAGAGGDGWVVLVFEDIEGRHPTQPWVPEELDRVVKSELRKWAEVIRDAKIKVD